MRILHTADWHLGLRWKGHRLLSDQFAQIDRMLTLCDDHRVDVLIVAGDVFETADPDELEHILRELCGRLEERVANGMSVLILPGNHDRESVLPILERAQQLGGRVERGRARVYFRARPAHILRTGRDGVAVQFLLLPYPTASRYPAGEGPIMGGPEHRARLAQSWRDELGRLSGLARTQADRPVIVVSHIYIRAADLGTPYQLSEEEDIPIEPGDLPGFAYWALGHIHKPGRVHNRREVWYSGALERLDMGEAEHERGAVLVEISPEGLASEPIFLRLPACPFYRMEVDGAAGMVGISDRYSEPERACVEVTLHYEPGVDNPMALRQELRRVFPRSVVIPRPVGEAIQTTRSDLDRHDVATTARRFVAESIVDEAQRMRVLALLNQLMTAVQR